MSLPAINLAPAFATPIATCLHPSPEALNKALTSAILGLEQDPTAARKQPSMRIYRNLFESDFHLFDRPDPALSALRDFCWSTLREVVGKLNGLSHQEMTQLRFTAHSWAHVTRKHGYFGTHNHPMVSWSGVYCVASGDEVPEYPDSGVLQFHNPLMMASMYEDAGNIRLRRPYGCSNINYRLVPGLLVLFPSWLVHEVLPYHGDSPRITVAFNSRVDPV